jgi:predicted metal-dependent HD superfamily phosphohydrolase
MRIIAFRYENWRAGARLNLTQSVRRKAQKSSKFAQICSAQTAPAQRSCAINFVVFSPIFSFSRSFLRRLEDFLLIPTLYHAAFCHESWRASRRINLTCTAFNV